MGIDPQEFLKSKHKSITLLGMSGVGKTYLSGLLEQWGWARYSCDYEIGNRYLKDQLGGAMRTPDDMQALSNFIGKLGNPKLGGLDFETFKLRQRAYYDAECRAVSGVPDAIKRAHENGISNFVHDSTGSLCEIMDESLLEALGRHTFFIYLKAGAEEERMVLERAQEVPKPLFFPPNQFEEWVREYLYEEGLDTDEAMEPDAFARWVFPKLFAARLPKYQGLADRYGITIECRAFFDVVNEKSFLKRIEQAINGA